MTLATSSNDSSPNRNAVFISYAHADNESPDRAFRWLDRLLEHLRPLEFGDLLDVATDRELELGDDWHSEIQDKLNRAGAAVLLVSPSFLASKYIRNNELPILLRRARDEGLKIIPVILRPCGFTDGLFKYPDPKDGPESFSIASLQAAGSPNKALNEMSQGEQDRALLEVARWLKRWIENRDSSDTGNGTGRKTTGTQQHPNAQARLAQALAHPDYRRIYTALVDKKSQIAHALKHFDPDQPGQASSRKRHAFVMLAPSGEWPDAVAFGFKYGWLRKHSGDDDGWRNDPTRLRPHSLYDVDLDDSTERLQQRLKRHLNSDHELASPAPAVFYKIEQLSAAPPAKKLADWLAAFEDLDMDSSKPLCLFLILSQPPAHRFWRWRQTSLLSNQRRKLEAALRETGRDDRLLPEVQPPGATDVNDWVEKLLPACLPHALGEDLQIALRAKTQQQFNRSMPHEEMSNRLTELLSELVPKTS